MRTDLIIVHFLGAEDVVRLLEHLGVWDQGTIWLVDNSAHEPGGQWHAQRLRDFCIGRSDITCLEPGANLGFARACNLAYSRSKADCVALINPDACIDREHLQRLVEDLERSPQVGAISPLLYWNQDLTFVTPPSQPQGPAALLEQMVCSWLPALAQRVALQDLDRSISVFCQTAPVKVGFLSGAVLLVRRQAAVAAAERFQLDAQQLFDPDYFMFFEDTDLSLRLRRTGWSLAVSTAASAVHTYRHKPFKFGMMDQSRLIFFRKHFPLFFYLTGSLRLCDRVIRDSGVQGPALVNFGPLQDYAKFRAKLGSQAVLALSPSMLGKPALFRAPKAEHAVLSPQDWELLENGKYVALIRQPTGEQYWCCFERMA